MRKNFNLKILIAAVLGLSLVCFNVPVQAISLDYILPGLNYSYFVKNETYSRLLDHKPNNFGQLMSLRNFSELDLEYHGIRHFRFFTKLRVFHDAVFDLENEGTGAHEDQLADKWEHNLDLKSEDWDPFLREAYVDIKYGKLEARLGKQIVSWGKSDGVYMLDVINNFNLRNIAIFEEEDIKIPNWMINLNYWFKGDNGLQLLFWPRYIPLEGPGIGKRTEWDFHDWTFQAQGGFPNNGSFDPNIGFLAKNKALRPSLSNASWALRWSGYAFDTTYTLNFLYTFHPFETLWWDTEHVNDATTAKYGADRLMTLGFSFDRGFPLRFSPLDMDNFVLRGEVAYTRNNVMYSDAAEIEEKDTLGYMFGFDTFLFVKWLTSVQLWQQWIINPRKWTNAYVDAGANKTAFNAALAGFPEFVGAQISMKDLGYDGKGGIIQFVDSTPNPGQLNYIANGKRDALKTMLTFFSFADVLPQKTLHPGIFLLWDPGKGNGWARLNCAYDWNDYTKIEIGTNWYWGNRDDVYGEFRDRSNIFLVLKFHFA